MIVEAGLLSFFRTLLIFIAIYYAFKLIIRFLFPIVLKWFVTKQQDKFNSQFSKKDESSAFKESNKRGRSEKIGDYVDYEEVDD